MTCVTPPALWFCGRASRYTRSPGCTATPRPGDDPQKVRPRPRGYARGRCSGDRRTFLAPLSTPTDTDITRLRPTVSRQRSTIIPARTGPIRPPTGAQMPYSLLEQNPAYGTARALFWNRFTERSRAMLYTPGCKAKSFGYKKLQASRGSKRLVEHSRRLEEVALVGGAGVHRGRAERLWPVFAHDRAPVYWSLRGVPLAVLFAAGPQARVATRIHHGAAFRLVDTFGFQGHVLLLPQGVLQGVLLGPAGLFRRGAAARATQRPELSG